jgi:hypothetical protein
MTPDQDKPRELAARELMRFYAEAGVDALLGEEPVDRFVEPAAPVQAAAPEPSPERRPLVMPALRATGSSTAAARRGGDGGARCRAERRDARRVARHP